MHHNYATNNRLSPASVFIRFIQSKQIRVISDRSHFKNCPIMGEKSKDSSSLGPVSLFSPLHHLLRWSLADYAKLEG